MKAQLLRPLLIFLLILFLPPAPGVLAHLDAPEFPPVGGEVPGTPVGTPCVDGFAPAGTFSFPCSNVDLLAWHALGGAPVFGNDIWGWTDPVTGTPYAILGIHAGTAFVDLADPTSPVHLGTLPVATIPSFWGDIKTYADHAYIVRDAAEDHGMQVYDLTQLRELSRDPSTLPLTLVATTVYDGIGSAHNLAINEETGFAYVVGADCAGGLHMLDLADPANPAFVGCFSGDGYTHDTQCVTYRGPDTEHQGREICFNANPAASSENNTLTIVDVTDKAAPVLLSRTTYDGAAYAHQGWLTEDHSYFLLGDELDELDNSHDARTYIWSVEDLDAPGVIAEYTGAQTSTDHNLFVQGNHVFEANYSSGLRVLEIHDLEAGDLHEVGYFDTWPLHDQVGFGIGAWGVYPFFEEHLVVVSDIVLGLFVLHVHIEDDALDVSVDIKPGSASNKLNLGSDGNIPVAILGSDHFNVTDVDPSTLAFGPAGTVPAHRAGAHSTDVDGNGFTDLLSHYATQEAGIAIGAPEACVTGELFDGTPFEGCDRVQTLAPQGPRCGLGFELSLLLPALALLGRRRLR